ncbi:MAG TPA: hypothetical protein VN934_03945 [Candidatus Tumulicola sp.]|nr:hypothetical protein [Candidatus Tumulicola sp.]
MRLQLSLAAVVLISGMVLSWGVAGAGTTRTCFEWEKNNPDATGVNLISLCQNELAVRANEWRATSDPIKKGHLQIGMGEDYWAIAYYCRYGILRHRNVDARCAPGTDHDLAVSSIVAAKLAYNNAKSDSNNAREIVKIADDLLAGEFNVPSASHPAWLPAPEKLCALLAKGIRDRNVAKWQRSDKGYFCGSQDMIYINSSEVYMTNYDATGPTKKRVSRFYLKVHVSANSLQKDQIAAPILSRLSAIFFAACHHDTPDDLAKAVRDVTTSSLSGCLGVAQTRFTPGRHDLNSSNSTDSNGSEFEVQLDVP